MKAAFSERFVRQYSALSPDFQIERGTYRILSIRRHPK